MKNIKSILLGVILSVFLIGTAQADTITNVSKYTPERPGVPYIEGQQGFSYASFNNFINNPNISIGGRQGDERKFLVGKYCPKGVCPTPGDYFNTLPTPIKEGDKIRFEIYFHNNGEDPYDGGGASSPNAKNVKIGIDLNDIQDPNQTDLIRPKGVIYSDSNEYRTDKNKPATVIKDSNGNPIKLATDDMQILLSEYGLELEPVKGSAWLAVKTDKSPETYYDNYVTKNTTITFDTVTPDTFSIQVAPYYTDHTAELHFNELPGCFRYSGFAYFDAEVIKTNIPQPENYCTSLTLTKQTQQTCNPNTKFTVFTAKVNFTDENVPAEQYIVFDSTDKKAKLTLNPPNQGTITTFPSAPQKVIGQFIMGMYDGVGTLKATYTDSKGTPIDGKIYNPLAIVDGPCTASIPACTDDCVNICVQHPVDIPAGSLSEFSAEATGYYGDTWSGDIKYYAEKGKGKFYTGKESEVIKQIKSDFPGANPYKNPNLSLGCIDLTNIIITPQNILNLIKDTFSAENSFNVNIPTTEILPQYNFIKPINTAPEQFYEIPENFKIKNIPTGGDPNPIDTKKFMNNVLIALDPKTIQPINDEPLNPFASYESPITAKEKETVWFYAAEEGDDSILVLATNTLNPDCSQRFDISPPSLCQSMTVSAYDKKSAVNKGNLPCINEGQMVEFQIDEVTTTDSKKLDLSKDKVSTLWTTTDPIGKFENAQKTFQTTNSSITYTGKGQVSCKVTSINGTADTNSLCTYGVATCPKVVEKCGKLDLKFNETPIPVASNKITTVAKTKEAKGAEMTLAIASDKNADYPSSVIWEDATEGELTFKNPQHVQKLPDSFMTKVVGGVETVVTIKNYSAKYPEAGMPTLKNAKHGGTVTAEVQGEESVCSAVLNVIEVAEIKTENVCRALTYQVQRMGDPASTWASNQSTLSNTENYLIKNTVTYSPDIDESLKFVDYKTTKGYFSKAVKIGEKPGAAELPRWLISALNGVMLPAGDVGWVQELKGIPAGKQVIFMPDKTLTPDPYPQAVEITASNSNQLTEPGCTKYIRLVVPASAKACKSITLNATPWLPASDQDKIKLYLTLGDLGDYAGNFSFSVYGSAKPYLSSDSIPDQNKLKSLDVSKNQAFETGVYLLDPDMSASWTVEVKASGEVGTICTNSITYAPPTIPPVIPPGGQTACSSLDITKPKSWVIDEDDDQEFEVSVQPTNYPWTIKWEVTGGSNAYFDKGKTTIGGYTNELKNISGKPKVTVYVEGYQTQCHDEIEASIVSENETPPSMKKKVAKGEMDDIDSDDWEDIINVSGRTLGKKSQPDQFITYKIEYKNGHNKGIKSVLIKDQSMKDGEIKSKGDLGGTLKFVDMTIKIGGDEIDKDEVCEYEKVSKDKNGNYKLHTTKPCVTTEEQADTDDEDLDVDWDDGIKKSFANDKDIGSKGLVFNNLKNDTKITIFYQMENKTALSDNTCKNLLAEDGCGEEFKNEASFEAYEGDNAQGSSKYDDTDSTKVIAVCPYILTRASGDVFFESTLETGAGIDVAYCSKQKNIQAPIITPIKEKEELVKSGGATRSATLTLPSHDICKYSNVTQKQAEENNKEPNPEDYQNPFENFSSTICEMKAEIAEDWVKKNVVDQISTNIEKISLWNTPQISTKLVQPPATAANGIFKWEKYDLTIGNGTATYTITEDATQSKTYIIKNANLRINSNIVYGTPSDPTNLKSYPSAAFIVINGDIIIDKDVEQLDGTYIAIDTDERDGKDTGKVLSTDVSYSQLTINGSLIGDVTDLFTSRKYVGNVAADEGSVTIKYNENFLLNPPPGLNQLMDIKQLEVAY